MQLTKFVARLGLAAVLLSTLSLQLSTARAQGTAFTYQGVLSQNGAAVSGSNDLTFTLYNAVSAGATVGTSNVVNDLVMTNGLFTVTLDFGAGAFDGSARWLQIAARPGASTGAYTNLTPRTPVTPTPYAMFAGGAALSGTYGSAVTFNNAANQFSGIGSNLTALNASQLTSGTVPVGALGNAWKITGNSNTAPGTHFLGSTDNQPLDFRVNNQRGLRLEYQNSGLNQSVNVIGGYSSNQVGAGIVGATISGGGSLNAIGGNSPNRVTGDFGTVGGGSVNTASGGFAATVGGGAQNTASGDYATVPGGVSNTATNYAFAAGNRAKAVHQGAFVWADSQNANFSSTANNQFLIRASGGVGIGTATPNNLLDVAAGGVMGNSTVLGIDYHDILNRGTKVSFGYNVLGSEFNGMRAVVNPGTAFCGNSGDLLFYTWECNTAASREVMRINGRGNVIASGAVSAGGNLSAGVDLSVGGYARISGNVGIGENSPGFPLNFGNILGDKIALFGNAAGAPSFGFGVQSSLLQIHTSDAGSDVAFGYGSSAAMTETMRIKGNGKVGIGTASPATALHVVGSADTELSIQSTDNNRRWTLQASGGPDGNPAFLGGYFQIIDRTAGASRLRIETNGNVTISAELTTTALNITSDRNAKEQFKPVNARDVLAKVVGLPISEWQYKTQSDARHIGPMAQDFREAFSLGRDDKHITSVDADGVALAAIQGLNEKFEEQTREKDGRIQELEKTVAELKALVSKLAGQQNGGAK